MILLIDAGNSRLKWATLSGEVLQNHGNYLHRERAFDMALPWGELPRPNAVYCASVAGDQVNSELAKQVKALWGVSVQMLHTTQRCAGVINGYRQAEKLGVDRWAALIAARQLTTSPLCVVDCGSAVTVDALDGKGQHLGGLIVPGLHMQQQLLLSETAAIDDIGEINVDNGWGRDTIECMYRGSLETVAGLIERAQRRLSQSQDVETMVFITGGDAETMIPLINIESRYEEHLVLQGIARMVKEQGA